LGGFLTGREIGGDGFHFYEGGGDEEVDDEKERDVGERSRGDLA
jgi:hypothetical protein